MILAASTLWQRELLRFYRQRSRIAGALGTPVVFWLLVGSGLGTSFRLGTEAPAGPYLEYFYPGTLALIVLFTAVFSTMSVIEDRHEGFLQGVLVAPIPRAAVVLGKVLGGTTLALGQAALFLLLAPLGGIQLVPAALPPLALVLFLIAFALTGLGFLLAWVLDSAQGFHAVMTLFLIPMWLLSGAVFPASGAAEWIRLVMAVNPLTYGVSALRLLLSPALAPGATPGESSLELSMLVMAAFGLAAFASSVAIVQMRRLF